jgi:hypothetical protein
MTASAQWHNWAWWSELIRGWLSGYGYGYCSGCEYELGCGSKCSFCDATAITYRYHTLTCNRHKNLRYVRRISTK